MQHQFGYIEGRLNAADRTVTLAYRAALRANNSGDAGWYAAYGKASMAGEGEKRMEEQDEQPVIVVDLGGTSIRAALVRGGTMRGRVRCETPAGEGPERVIEAIAGAIERVMRAEGVHPQAAIGEVGVVAIASPGPLNAAKGIVYSAPNLLGWHDVPLGALLEERIGLRVQLLKDANAAALAEHSMGAGRGASTMVYVTLSTGIGGGLILNGELFEGPDGTAGEVGHMTIDEHGPICNCGNRGCVETKASGTAIARRAAALIAAGTLRIEGTHAPSAAQVIAAAHAGNAAAGALIGEAGGSVGLALVGIIHLFNPEVIVLGGGLIQAGPLLLAPIEAAIERHAIQMPRSRARIAVAALGDDAGLWGAAIHARSGGMHGKERSQMTK